MDLLVIGGGAAGLMAAVIAAERGLSVTVLEKNGNPGKKLLITGKGRCNVTNNCTPEELLRNVRSNPRFLMSAFHRFSPDDVINFFETRGVPLKTERGRRVFPVSDRASDIVGCLLHTAKLAGVHFHQGKVQKLLFDPQGQVIGAETSEGARYFARYTLIATGGMSYPATGSTGDGYQLAKSAGHTIVPPRPSLAPVEVAERDECRELMGLTLKNVTLTLTCEGKTLYSELGEMLFAHFGLTGPLVLSASAFLTRPLSSQISVDLKPGLTMEQLDQKLVNMLNTGHAKALKNILSDTLPQRLILPICTRSDLDPFLKGSDITREMRRSLLGVLKAYTFTPERLGSLDEAIVTAGGINVKEIEPGTMRSRLRKGLLFAGEVLDVDAFTGGYNLQIAWSTAAVAAESIPYEGTENDL